jgi:hypothetical protein
VVGAYPREIGRTPLLLPEEEVVLVQRVARGDTEAARALAQATLRLVVTIAPSTRSTFAVTLPCLEHKSGHRLAHTQDGESSTAAQAVNRSVR